MIHYDSQPETNSRLVLLETVTNKRIFNREKKRLARKYCSQIQPNDEKRERSDAKRTDKFDGTSKLSDTQRTHHQHRSEAVLRNT